MCQRTRDLAGGPGVCHFSNPIQRVMLRTRRLPRRFKKRLLKFYLTRIHNGDMFHVLLAELRANHR